VFQFDDSWIAGAREAAEWAKHAKTLIDSGKAVWKAGKDLKEYFKDKPPEPPKEIEPKVITFEWLDKTPFKEKAKEAGFEVGLVNAKDIATKQDVHGWEILYEIDLDANTKRRLVMYDGLTLMGKRT